MGTTEARGPRVMVAVSSSRASGRLVRYAAAYAGVRGGGLLAVYVEIPAGSHAGRRDTAQLLANLNLSESLGAETVTLHGTNVARALLSFARERGIDSIVMGRSPRGTLLPWRRRSLTDEVIEGSEGIAVTVVAAEWKAPRRGSAPREPAKGRPLLRLQAYLYGALLMAGATGMALALRAVGLSKQDIVMTYLLGIVCVAFFFGRGPDIMATVLAVLSFNFFFTEPYFTLVVNDLSYIFTFIVMLVVGVIVSELATRIRGQTEAARQREQRTESLYRLSKRLSQITGLSEIARAAEEEMSALLRMRVEIFLPGNGLSVERDPTPEGAPATGRGLPQEGPAAAELQSGSDPRLKDPGKLQSVRCVLDTGRMAGMGTEVFADSRFLFLPLTGPHGVVGVLVADPSSGSLARLPDLKSLLETFCGLISFAIDRERLSEESQRARRRMETERTRSALLSSLSHDLRTPIAGIAGAASSLLELYGKQDEATRRSLIGSISEEAGWLSRMVENLLSMTRLEAEPVTVNRQWQPVEEVIGSALARLDKVTAHHPVRVGVPEELCLVWIDDLLIEQALINLIDNADKYSADGSSIEVRVVPRESEVVLEIADRGMGVSPGEVRRLFDKFYRGRQAAESGVRGAGIGLSICKAVAEAHGGRIWAEPREGGGSVFRLALPRGTPPPEQPELRSDD